MFDTIGLETARRYEQDEIRGMLAKLTDEEEYGRVLRAKGILQNAAGGSLTMCPEKSTCGTAARTIPAAWSSSAPTWKKKH